MLDKPVLPDFTRWAWDTPASKAWWMPLIEDASRAYGELELLSVVEGIRPAAYQMIHASDLPAKTEWAYRHGLVAVPMVAMQGANAYTSSGRVVGQSGEYSTLRVLFVRGGDYQRFRLFDPTNITNDDDRLGIVLGYPACCRRAFANTWVQGQVDSTYEQVAGARYQTIASTLLRWMGVRLVSHLPCHYNCEASLDIASAMWELGMRSGFHEEMTTIKDMLRWKVSGSRLFGISEIIFPCLKIVARTDWTPTKETFALAGTDDAVREWLWTDNGFAEPTAMRRAHRQLINVLEGDVPRGLGVFDLGCGNGLLVRKLKQRRPDIRIGGIDANPSAIGHIPALAGHFRTCRIEDLETWRVRGATAFLLNPARLLEMEPETARTLLAVLAPQKVYLYAYPDWTQQESLPELAARAGFGEIRMLAHTPDVSVGVVH